MHPIVDRLVNSLTVTGLSPRRNGDKICALIVDGDLECNIELDQSEEWLYLHAPIVRPPEENLTNFFASLLRTNCFGIGTDGGQLGLCEHSGMIVYSRRRGPENLDSEDFREEFDRFVSVALALRDQFLVSSLDEDTAHDPTRPSRDNVPTGLRV